MASFMLFSLHMPTQSLAKVEVSGNQPKISRCKSTPRVGRASLTLNALMHP